MAITATISVAPSTVVTEQKATAKVTISNSGAYPVNVVTIQGYALPHGASVSNYNSGVSVGVVNTGPSTNLVVPAGGDLVLNFDLKFHAPSTGVLSAGSQYYDVSANIVTDDGSNTSPTAATVTVNYVVTYPASQQ